MKAFLKKHWRCSVGIYIVLYLLWFYTLEHTIYPDHPGLHIMNTAIDSRIPFCEYFILAYMFWFVYLLGSVLLVFKKGTDAEFIRYAVSLMAGMSLSLLVCTVYPNGLTLRPSVLPDNFCGHLVAMIYASDTPTNVFPSIHVYDSIAIHIALCRISYLKNRKWVKPVSFFACFMICISTLFVKQHSVLDVLGGAALAAVLYLFIYKIDYSRLFHRNA